MIVRKFCDILLTHVENPLFSYHELQQFSAHFDKDIGFNIQKIENEMINNAKELYPAGNAKSWGKSIYNGSEAWIGLAPDQLQTTYSEFYESIQFLSPNEDDIFCDLGAGYGRLGILIGFLFSHLKFIGIEIVQERVNEGNRVFNSFSFNNVVLNRGTLGKMKIPFAHYYFIYDFGSIVEIDSVLNDISEQLKRGPVTVIARGRGVRSIINHKHHWLSLIYQGREETFGVYSSSLK